MLGEIGHVEEAKALNIEALDQDDMKAFQKDKKKIKKWAKPFRVLLASEKLMKRLTKLMGR